MCVTLLELLVSTAAAAQKVRLIDRFVFNGTSTQTFGQFVSTVGRKTGSGS